MLKSTIHFNREILIGEVGALILANVSAPVVGRFSHDATVIAWAAVGATMVGGGLFWLGARIYDQVRGKTFTAPALASDVAYFTPGALLLGLGVYDPLIFVVARRLVLGGSPARVAVAVGQVTAFAVFLACLNLYRLVLLRFRGKAL